MTLLRRGLLATLFASLAFPVFAQNYPNKPIRVIVPFPAGGGTDIIARDVTNKLSSTLGWSFVVENKPGSGGNLGVDAAAKAAGDGYTLALGQTSNLAINPTLYSKMPYDSLKDLAPVGLVASAPLVLVVAADSPYKTLADIVNASKAKPASLNFASPGNGTVAHLASELFQKTAGVKFTHIPYKGAAQASTDLIGGQVQLYMSSVPTLLGHIKNGKMRALAVTSLNRVDDLPQVPTVAESGYKGFEAVTWFGFVAPTAVPKDIVVRLNTEINKALQSADVKKKLGEQGADVLGGTPEQFSALIKSDIARWAPIIKESGAKLD
ncbi:Bug family tripartite tricarboxylate transporter substrate binding protein [Rhodoferax ferrireducens]|uniref:Bug family tripartite tricarboxylate transporter substrate binding protein n=1 Tax=Rhodoferax ferrireducens TaxID=192843 RepID=UPI000E0D6D6B|nr:tripartite tricarboxylate transporter substrate binding protein [Rhodoferax ferrireducens]